ncbi:phage tail protein, partial [Pseudomonas aeruginosa]
MDKLRALTTYLIDRQLVPAEQLDSFAEQVSLTLVWKPERESLRLGDMSYRAVVILERLTDAPARMMALGG